LGWVNYTFEGKNAKRQETFDWVFALHTATNPDR